MKENKKNTYICIKYWKIYILLRCTPENFQLPTIFPSQAPENGFSPPLRSGENLHSSNLRQFSNIMLIFYYKTDKHIQTIFLLEKSTFQKIIITLFCPLENICRTPNTLYKFFFENGNILFHIFVIILKHIWITQ